MNNLKPLREGLGLSQSDVARSLKTTQQTYQRWETGKAKPPIDALQSLAILFKVPLSKLAGTPDAVGLGFDPHNHILSGDQTGFWGHLGLQLAGHSTALWYPISAERQDKLETTLLPSDDIHLVLDIPTLNNRLLLCKPAHLTRLRLLDEACDEPRGEPFFHERAPLKDENGLPTALYAAMTDITEEAEEAEESIRTEAERIISEAGLAEQDLFDILHQTRIYMVDGSIVSLVVEPENMIDLSIELNAEYDLPYFTIQNASDGSTDVIPKGRIALIDMPLHLFHETLRELYPDSD